MVWISNCLDRKRARLEPRVRRRTEIARVAVTIAIGVGLRRIGMLGKRPPRSAIRRRRGRRHPAACRHRWRCPADVPRIAWLVVVRVGLNA